MKVYLAGPDVFKPEKQMKQWFTFLKEELKKRGHEGLSPMDTEIQHAGEITRQEMARQIFEANQGMIRQCDVVLANVSPFRGPSIDPGTAWELGFASALGKGIFMYSYDDNFQSGPTYKSRCQWMERAGVRIATPEYPIVEDFGLTDNLMISLCGTMPAHCLSENVLSAIIAMERYYKENPLGGLRNF